MRIESIKFTGLDYTAQAPVAAAGTPGRIEHVFDLTNEQGHPVDRKNSIARIAFNDGEGDYIDGFSVTYNYIDPKTGKSAPGAKPVIHGTFREAEVHHKVLQLKENEYICGARVLYVNKDTEEQYIGRITLWATRPDSDHAYQAGDWGETPKGQSVPEDWHWDKKDGRLFVFGARQNNSEETMGLKTLAFGEFHDEAAIAQSDSYPAIPVSTQSDGKTFDDLKKYGAVLNLRYPIKCIEVWHDEIVEGIQVTYNLNNNCTVPVLHGSKVSNISPTRIDLNENETVVEITGIHGEACPKTQLGDRINLLDFKVYNKKAGMYRNSGTCGKIQEDFNQQTRKDICIRGPLVALAGRAERTKRYGLHNIQGFTRVLTETGLGNQTKSSAAPNATANGATNGNPANGAANGAANGNAANGASAPGADHCHS
ncbi:hypothetical protein RhiJN_20123 [Ceratobasidium sp. AG-Ba]|nr:hypothetical protein RhiJN_20123 [Ceratobasidium sp. AG-Ba]